MSHIPSQNGNRQSRPGWPSELYGLNLIAKAALRLDKKNVEDFLRNASNGQLRKFIDLFS